MTYLIDAHTHILPGIDDGASDINVSLEMLREEKRQGVDLVVLTPHFYRKKETIESFLDRRHNSFMQLLRAIDNKAEEYPDVIIGAEVAWAPNMARWEDLEVLCFGNTSYMLLEMPFGPWSSAVFSDIYEIIDHGIIPVFAHLERYVEGQKKEHIEEIFSLGTPIQYSCAPLLHVFERQKQLKMMKNTEICLLGSDCHNMTKRPPLLKQGLEAVGKYAGQDMYDRLLKDAMKISGWSKR